MAGIAGTVRGKSEAVGRVMFMTFQAVGSAINVVGLRLTGLGEIGGWRRMAYLTNTGLGAVGKSAGAAKANGGAIDCGDNHHAVGGTVGIMAISAAAA